MNVSDLESVVSLAKQEPEAASRMMGNTAECRICYLVNEATYLNIFATEHADKNIASLIAKHLWFEVVPTREPQLICFRCWSALDEFNAFYNTIEECRRMRTEEPVHYDDDTNRSTVSPACFAGPTEYKTEFLEIKGEPVEDDDDDEEDERRSFVLSDGYLEDSTERPHVAAVKSEATEEDAPCSSQHRKVRNRTRHRKQTKLVHTRAKRKVPSSVQKMEDAELLEFYKRIVCEVCDNQRMMVGDPLIDYGSWTALLRHSKVVHGHYKIYVQCPVCEMKLRTKVTLWQHMDMHKNPEKYRCEVCAEIHQNMKEHMQNKHEERQYSCDLCASKFPFKKRLVVHMKKMHAEKDVRCDQCQKSFTKYTIEDHKRSVHTARFVCEHCPKTFKIRFRLLKHMQEHDKSLRVATCVPCHICDQVMGDKYILRQHIKHMHAEQQSVNCDTCGKTFKNKRNLSVHLANVCMKLVSLHSCSICDKQFRHLNKLKDHMASCSTPN
ncbi:zinc finger protein 652-B-like [Anopheles cruzii]|uniref:zinc finger protein 652-B-like n=1 Tax=Anopheles cruzii TaxID=68878 RepID=UPI0022EC7FC5|nr:zinc finger protein 652-B-like [Anopheles cruzii]